MRTHQRPSLLLGALFGLLPVLLALSSCSAGEDAISPADRARVQELIAATTLPPPESGALVKGEWFDERDAAFQRAFGARQAVGREALRVYAEETDLPTEARQALLKVAAHHVPGDTTPILVELIEHYGVDLDLRKEACAILAGAAPELACDVLEPLIRNSDKDGTFPPAEAMLSAYVEAARASARPLDEVLARIATDIYQDSAVRHRAVRELGSESGWRAEAALEQVLIESTGNAYLRRLAAQAMLKSMTPAAACEVFKRVYDREADDRFMLFLADAIQRNCQNLGDG